VPNGIQPDCSGDLLPLLDGGCVDLGLADCGDDPWGPRPWPEGTLFVSADAPEEAADGSREHPFGRIADALAAAGAGGSVAVAGGVYAGDLLLTGEITLGGRCARDVWIEGTVLTEPEAEVRLHDLSLDAVGALATLRVELGSLSAERLLLTGAEITAVLTKQSTFELTDSVIDATRSYHGVTISDRSDGVLARCLVTAGLSHAVQFYDHCTARISTLTILAPGRIGAGSAGVSLRIHTEAEVSDVLVLGGFHEGLLVDDWSHVAAARYAVGALDEHRPERGFFVGDRGQIDLDDAYVSDTRAESMLVMGGDSEARVSRLLVEGGFGATAGGAIPVMDGGVLELTDAVVAGYSGGGLYVGGSGATATVRRLAVRGVVPSFETPEWAFGVAVQAGGALVLADSLVEENTGVGVSVQDPESEISMRRVTVRDTRGAGQAAGRAIQATAGGVVRLVDGLVADSGGLGVLAVDPGTLVTAERVGLLGTSPPAGLDGNAVQATGSARVELTDVLLEDTRGTGVTVADPDSVVVLQRAAVLGTRVLESGLAGSALVAQDGGAIRMADVELAGNQRFGLQATGAATSVEAVGLAVRGTLPPAAGASGVGIGAADGAALSLDGCLLVDNQGVGLALRDEGTSVAVTRCTVRSTRAPVGTLGTGRGVDVTLGARLTLDGLLVDDNQGMGLSVIGIDTRAQGSRLAVTATLASPSDGTEGYGIAASDAATVELDDVLVADNREIGVLVVNAARATFGRLAVTGTAPSALGFGDGVFVDDDGWVEATGLYVADNTRTGLVVSQSGARLTDGLLTENGTGLVRQLTVWLESEHLVVQGNGRDDEVCEQACMDHPPEPTATGG